MQNSEYDLLEIDKRPNVDNSLLCVLQLMYRLHSLTNNDGKCSSLVPSYPPASRGGPDPASCDPSEQE